MGLQREVEENRGARAMHWNENIELTLISLIADAYMAVGFRYV